MSHARGSSWERGPRSPGSHAFSGKSSHRINYVATSFVIRGVNEGPRGLITVHILLALVLILWDWMGPSKPLAPVTLTLAGGAGSIRRPADQVARAPACPGTWAPVWAEAA